MLRAQPGQQQHARMVVPAYVAWRAGTTTLFLLDSWPPIDYLKIPAQESQSSPIKLRKKCEQQ
jgi:hypothetical protein